MPKQLQTRPTKSRHRELHQPERLEDRLVMDGAGFVNTDPPEDPDSIVGVAGIVANDDYTRLTRGAQSIRISPLANDELPDDASRLSIKLVSDTAQGATVAISEDRQHLIYTAAGDEGFQGWDSFYYIVQTEDGKLGKANVQLGLKVSQSSYSGGSRTYRSSPNYSLLEDTNKTFLNVAQRFLDYPEYEGAVIVSATMPAGGGVARISDDGQGLWYQPQYAFTGRDDVMITVRAGDNEEYNFGVRISVVKPYTMVRDDSVYVEPGTGPTVFSPLRNDVHKLAFETSPYIESATVPDYVGTVRPTANGQQITFTPAPDFKGAVSVTYTVRYGDAAHQTVTGVFSAWVADGYQAVENYFLVNPDSPSIELDVLANDANFRKYYGLSLRIVDVSAPNAGGTVTHDGSVLHYQPAAGYEGDETFTYTVESSSGVRQTARVTVEVAPRAADPFGVPQFATQRELEQYLIDRAVKYYGGAFGHYVERYAPLPEGVVYRSNFVTDDVSSLSLSRQGGDYSETNTQVDGVDEADIVETDGRYVYSLSSGKLAIVDLIDPSNPVLVSLTEFETKIDEMYLQGDRLTLIHRGSLARPFRSRLNFGYSQELDKDSAVVQVLDISDRTAPTLLERTEIDGAIVDSRAIGPKIHLVTQRWFEYPELGGSWIVEPVVAELEDLPVDPLTGKQYVSSLSQLDMRGVWANESLEEYLARVRDQLIETGLSSFSTFNAAGGVVASGLLTAPTNLHKAQGGEDLVDSLFTIDVGDAAPGLAAAATSFIADNKTTVYVSTESAYVFAYNARNDITTISKMDLSDDGALPLVATGQVRGKLLNQFSADEYDGRLRVATTQQERTHFNNGQWRQQRLFNNLQVIEQHGSRLEVIGKIENLAPTETIKSVRFLGERAYVVTFRVVDPLFSIDLSNPTTPVVRGALKIPGFSDYLHPVGRDYLLAIGRDADEITGRLGPFQITLFHVSDLDHPAVADQVTFEGAAWVSSEAWIDHHAVAFFEESGVLAVPLAWSEEVTKHTYDGSSYQTYDQYEATWTFEVKTNGNAKLKATGKIEHPKPSASGFVPLNPIATTAQPVITDVWFPLQRLTPQPMQRALRIEDALVTVSKDWLQVHKLNNPKQQLGKVHYGLPVANDSFTINEDSGPHTFDVLANDPPTATDAPAVISAVSDVTGGTARVSKDGRSVVFTPDENFFGIASFTYVVDAPLLGEVTARVTVSVRGAPDNPVAVDDTFALDVSSETVELDVLANDLNPDFSSRGIFSYYFVSLISGTEQLNPTSMNYGLVIAEVGPSSNDAVVEVTDEGLVAYTPAEGFEGIDTFDYTISDRLGRTNTATVTVYIGVQPPSEEPTSSRPPTAEHKAGEEPIVKEPREPAGLGLVGLAWRLDTNRDAVFETFKGHGLLHRKPEPMQTISDPGRIDPTSLWANLVDRAYSEQADWRLDPHEIMGRDSDSHADSAASSNTEELTASVTSPVRRDLAGFPRLN